MERIKQLVSRRIIDFARERYEVALDPPGFLYPPSPDLGDLALAIAFDLAKQLKKPPRALAEEIGRALDGIPGLRQAAPAGGGYVNLFLERPAYLRHLTQELSEPPASPSGAKVIVEHTNINPNKAAHIGHLRNAALGDTLARALRFLGRRVEVQNYIDDTGVQVADLVIGVTRLEKLDLQGVLALEKELERQGKPLDYWCWDLYARVTQMYEEEPEPAAGTKSLKERLRGETLRAMEEGTSPVARLAAHLADRIVRRHLATMERVGVRYDLLPRESDILAHRFWEAAFERLKSSGHVSLATTGKNSGCWVMDLSGNADFANLTEGEKILVRSNGTVTYVGKDIAYQLWKFGLLGSDFEYRPYLTYPSGELLWATTGPGAGAPAEKAGPPAFGGGETIYNVIDVRQAYLQKIVVESLRLLGHEEQAGHSIHFSYEMVALSPRTAADLGMAEESSQAGKSFLEMSGRKGIGVKADDLIDHLTRRAAEEVATRNPDLPEPERLQIAAAIGVGALRYYMLRFTRNKIIAFDFTDALSFDGETGPYVQYAAVRAAGILGKVAASLQMSPEELLRWASEGSFGFLEEDPKGEEWELLSLLGRQRSIVEQAVSGLEFSLVAKHAFVLAQKFNGFYHRHPVLQEPDTDRRKGKVLLTILFRRHLISLLGLMGIPVPSLM
ncbi:MAG TPA: arginine--tRNA ligase [Candidatus Polarisedimenticolia bacterium]|nr:arginine--tRNA ligase [Candidatus Polarisedimenticolia bacterium]